MVYRLLRSISYLKITTSSVLAVPVGTIGLLYCLSEIVIFGPAVVVVVVVFLVEFIRSQSDDYARVQTGAARS